MVEIIIFSQNQVIIRPTQIIINLLKDHKIIIFKVIFECWKSIESLCQSDQRFRQIQIFFSSQINVTDYQKILGYACKPKDSTFFVYKYAYGHCR